MNTIAPDFLCVISKVDNGKGGTALLYHLSLKLIKPGTLSLGRVAWAQFQLDSMIISISIVYAPNDSTRARAYLWHQLKGKLHDKQWTIFGDFNMTEGPLDSSGPTPLLNGSQKEA